MKSGQNEKKPCAWMPCMMLDASADMPKKWCSADEMRKYEKKGRNGHWTVDCFGRSREKREERKLDMTGVFRGKTVGLKQYS